ncbi:MAG: tetratricopeptide repeat protein [Alphaproteobacteria bacterium]|nr:tetratricopeptide repeat protein [Alphaproteobacteria bacterium]
MISQSQEWSELFIGRESELEWLKSAWKDVKLGEPRLRVLRGESGLGKTQILQKFYSWLSHHEAEDPEKYWPDLLLKERINLQLNPPMDSFGDAKQIPWLWWGIRWADPEGRNLVEACACGLLNSMHYLEPHRIALVHRAEQMKRTGAVAAKLIETAFEALSLGSAGTLMSVYELAKIWKDERASAKLQSLSVEDRQMHVIKSQLQELSKALQFMLNLRSEHRSGFPIILVLDDAQWMDALSLSTINQLFVAATKQNWPLFVIATHWEREWNTQSMESNVTSFPNLFHLLQQETDRPSTKDAVLLRDVTPLDGLEAVLLSALPGLTSEQVAFLSERADGNPRLMHEMILELRDEAFYFENENPKAPLTADAIEEMKGRSFALDEVQRRRFRNLNQDLRRLLSYASFHGMRFLKDMVIEVSQVLDAEDDGQGKSLEAGVHPYAVLAENSAVIYEFRSRLFHQLARERVEKLSGLNRRLAEGLLEVGLRWLDNHRQERLPLAERELFYLLMLEHYETDISPSENLEVRLLAGLVEHYAEREYYARALPQAKRLAACWHEGRRADFDAIPPEVKQGVLYMWHRLGLLDPALSLGEALLEQCQARLASDSFGVEQMTGCLFIQDTVGNILRDQSRLEDALVLYQASMESRRSIMDVCGENPASADLMAESIMGIGNILWALDRLDDALAQYSKAFDIRQRVIDIYGETPVLRHNLARSQSKIGQLQLAQGRADEALVLFQASLDAHQHLLDTYGETVTWLEHATWLRAEIGEILLRTGQPEKGVALYRTSMEGLWRIFEIAGTSPDRLEFLSSLLAKLSDLSAASGRIESANDLDREALAVYQRALDTFSETF